MKKQTAVEWIEEYLKKFNHIEESLSIRKAFEKAKEMEIKEKRLEYMNGWVKGFSSRPI